MEDFRRKIREILRNKLWNRRMRRILWTTAAVVVFITTYALILPALSLDEDTAETAAGVSLEEKAEKKSDSKKKKKKKSSKKKAKEAAEETAAFKAAAGKVKVKISGAELTIQFTKKAGLPEDVSVTVDEYTADAKKDEEKKAYESYRNQAEKEAKDNGAAEITQGRFFNLHFFAGEQEITPEAGVDISVKYKNNLKLADGEKLQAVQYGKDSVKLLKTKTKGGDAVSKASFTLKKFPALGLIVTRTEKQTKAEKAAAESAEEKGAAEKDAGAAEEEVPAQKEEAEAQKEEAGAQKEEAEAQKKEAEAQKEEAGAAGDAAVAGVAADTVRADQENTASRESEDTENNNTEKTAGEAEAAKPESAGTEDVTAEKSAKEEAEEADAGEKTEAESDETAEVFFLQETEEEEDAAGEAVENAAKETAAEESAAEEESAEGTIAVENTAEENSVEETAEEEITTAATIADETTAEETTAEEISTEETTAEEMTADETTAEDVSAEETSAEEAAAEESTAEELADSDEEAVYEAGELVFDDNTADYKVVLSYTAAAKIPSDATLSVREIKEGTAEYEAYRRQAEAAVAGDPDRQLTFARAFDITILAPVEIESEDGGMTETVIREIQPAVPVSVQILLDEAVEVAPQDEVKAVHVETENGAAGIGAPEGQVTAVNDVDYETAGKNSAEVKEVSFDADGFSVWMIVGTTIEKTVLASDGHNYRITATYGAETGIPADADLAVEEISADSELYGEYVSKTENALGMEEGSAGYIRLFDISIIGRDDPGIKYQPAAGTAVDIRIELADSISEWLNVVHFADGEEEGKTIDSITENGEACSMVGFQADSFSVYSIVDAPEPAAIISTGWYTATSLNEIEELGEKRILCKLQRVLSHRRFST